jgi:sulfatase maturation enzyme AslB (radical SAM superfamily)
MIRAIQKTINKLIFKCRLKEYNKTRNNGNVIFCYAPSKALRFSLNGHAFVCCFNRLNSLGRYPNNSISDIWNNSIKEDLHKSINYKQNNTLGCHYCYDTIMSKSFHLTGARNYDNYNNEVTSNYPLLIDFELSNTCNLKCIMCNGENSSSIRSQIEKKDKYTDYYDDVFLDQLTEFIPYLKETRFSGGEPFLIDLYYDLWDKIHSINPLCKIIIQTNGTIINEKILELYSKYNFHLSFSIDSVNKTTYESIRIGASFEKVMSNFEIIHKLSQKLNREIGVSICILKNNIREFRDYVNYFNNLNTKITIHKVLTPINHSIYSLSISELESIKKDFISYKFTSKNSIEEWNNKLFSSVLFFIESVLKLKKANDTNKEIQTSKNSRAAFISITQRLVNKNNSAIPTEKLIQKIEELIVNIDKIQNSKEVYDNIIHLPDEYIISELNINDIDRILSRIIANKTHKNV